MSEENLHPEHSKLLALGGKNQDIGEFLEWLQQKVTFCRWREVGNNGEPRYLYASDPISSESHGELVAAGYDWVRSERRYAKPNPDYESWSEGWEPVHRSIESWLAEYFEIDGRVLESEKRDMLERLRASYKQEGS